MLHLQKVVESITGRLLGCSRNSQTLVLSFDTKDIYTRSKFFLKYLHIILGTLSIYIHDEEIYLIV